MSKKLRFFLEYFVHYLKTYSLVILLGIACGSLIYAKRNFLIEKISTLSNQRKRIGIEGLYSPGHLPPEIAQLISYGITTVSNNEKTELSPIIDKMEVGEDNLVYTFYFKDNLYWHNGRKFRTSDLNLKIEGTTIVYNTTNSLTITLQTPFSPLLSLLSQPIFYNNSLVGIGKYKVTKSTYRDGYLKNLEITTINKPTQQITYKFYSNSSDLINGFKLGEVDQIEASVLAESNSWDKAKINPNVSFKKYLAVFINSEKHASKTFRQALAYATPKTNDNNQRCLGPISPSSWAYNPQIKPYNYNPTRAKELIDKDHPNELVLVVTDRQLLSTAEIIKKSWHDVLGIEVKISIENQKPDLKTYDAILTYGTIPSDPDQYKFWHSTQSNTNITHLNNSRIDKLVEEGRLVQNQLERKQIYQDFQKFLLEESPVIFLEFPTTYNISRIQ